VERGTPLADRMTYRRARRIPPFLRIPYLSPLPRFPPEEESRNSGSKLFPLIPGVTEKNLLK